MPELLAGKTVLVMGIANRWSIAYAIARSLAREGAQLILTCQGERLRSSVEELARTLNTGDILECDVGNDASLDALFATLRQRGVVLDAVIHSIAFANREDLEQAFERTSRPGFALALEVSAYSLVAVSHRALELMTRGGSIVTLSYLGAVRAVPNYNVMGVAKAALEASVRYLASELGSRNIRVNAISAGPIKTASARAVKDFSSILDVVATRSPLRRTTDPAEVGDAAAFLCSDLARGVTGDILYVDSGFHIV
jgi:enoyl-[acyl-carrier protein] reductase I